MRQSIKYRRLVSQQNSFFVVYLLFVSVKKKYYKRKYKYYYCCSGEKHEKLEKNKNYITKSWWWLYPALKVSTDGMSTASLKAQIILSTSVFEAEPDFHLDLMFMLG